ncbi:MAG: hypothetical protein OYG32_03685, partial [Rhodospirillaceae bacterium]|nr:hypothetical protein [Rhodospirillaceae bacterium]
MFAVWQIERGIAARIEIREHGRAPSPRAHQALEGFLQDEMAGETVRIGLRFAFGVGQHINLAE